MYSDRVEEDAGKRSVKERINGNPSGNFIPRRQIAGKRQRQDDKWEHDLYQEDGPNVSDHKVDARDLRLKLQRKSLQNVSQSGRGTLSGVRDLHEKLSGTMNADPPKQKAKVNQPARKSIEVETPEPESRRAANAPERKKAKQSVDTSLEGFLQSLGLEKYAITFQAEEVDMTALVHMTDGDLKALSIPMSSLPVKSVTKADHMRECLRSLKLAYKDDNAKVKKAFQTLLIYVGNVARSPDEEKFRKIRLSNPKFQERVGSLKGGIKCLELCGFERSEGEEFLVFPRDKVDVQSLNTAGSMLKSALTNPYFGLLEKMKTLELW